MSACLQTAVRYRCMSFADLEVVMAIETSIYAHPWTRGNFRDSLNAGYHCWMAEVDGAVAGYSVSMIAVGEAHLLNLSVAEAWQRRGVGADLLRFNIDHARKLAAGRIFLEVRPSNTAAIALYRRAGFTVVGLRRAYYPGAGGREDAVVMELVLQ